VNDANEEVIREWYTDNNECSLDLIVKGKDYGRCSHPPEGRTF